MQVQTLGQEDPPEEGMATHSSIFAWRILWTEEPGGLVGSRAQAQYYGAQTQLLSGMWNLPIPGIQDVFPALAQELSSTVPPGKSYQ